MTRPVDGGTPDASIVRWQWQAIAAMRARMSVFLRIILPVAAAAFVVDRLSKWWVVEVLDLETKITIEAWPPWLTLRMAWNTGINFGLFGGGSGATRWVLVGIAVVISLALTWWAARRRGTGIAIGAGLVVGGALGNAWDRISHWQAVADFLSPSCCGIDNPFSFNVADIAIFGGAIWIALRA